MANKQWIKLKSQQKVILSSSYSIDWTLLLYEEISPHSSNVSFLTGKLLLFQSQWIYYPFIMLIKALVIKYKADIHFDVEIGPMDARYLWPDSWVKWVWSFIKRRSCCWRGFHIACTGCPQNGHYFWTSCTYLTAVCNPVSPFVILLFGIAMKIDILIPICNPKWFFFRGHLMNAIQFYTYMYLSLK